MKIHGYGSEAHYTDHVSAVMSALGDAEGTFYGYDLATLFREKPNRKSKDWWLVASVQDASALKSIDKTTKVILIEHGVGQTYIGSTGANYIGPQRTRYADVFWMPNERAAALQSVSRNAKVRVMYPHRLDLLQRIRDTEREKNPKPVVVFSFHHDQHGGCPEQRSAWRDWLPYVEDLLKEGNLPFEIMGHAHPREPNLFDEWLKRGVSVLSDFTDVIRYADVYACDNSSTIYEAAGVGIPVVLLNGYSYRPAVKHGLRFYQYADVGLVATPRNHDPKTMLLDAITRTLNENPQRERAVEICSKLFPRDASTAAELAAELMEETVSKATPGSVKAQALRDIKNPKTGTVKAGQVFYPGFHHHQYEGQAVRGHQTHPRPDAALALMVSNRMAVAIEEMPAVNHTESPAEEHLQSPEETPIRRRTHADTDRNPRPISSDVGGSEGPPASVDESVSNRPRKKTRGSKGGGGSLLSE